MEEFDRLDEMDAGFMRRAIELALQGEGWCHPNPMVGAVIVKEGRILGEGYHEKCGELHAERNAFADAKARGEDVAGATIYVTLEPCCHHGKTPPCTDAIIENKIARVVIGSRDPNPKVSHGGVEKLLAAGIEVREDFLREECDEINPVFFHYIAKKKPYVTLKYAMTMDGKIATKMGKSKWISNETSREYVQFLRHKNMAILVGSGTVKADNPRLNCRMPGGHQPVKIVCGTIGDSDWYTGLSLFSDLNDSGDSSEPSKVIFATGSVKETPIYLRAKRDLEAAKATVINLPGPDGKVDMASLMEYLGKQEIDSVLVEGGGVINEAMLRAGLVDEIIVFLAPKIFGGKAKSPVMGVGVETPDLAYNFVLKDIEYFGDDLMIRYVKDVDEEM